MLKERSINKNFSSELWVIAQFKKEIVSIAQRKACGMATLRDATRSLLPVRVRLERVISQRETPRANERHERRVKYPKI